MARTAATPQRRRRAPAGPPEPRPRPVRVGVAMPDALLRDLLLLRLNKEKRLELVGCANDPTTVFEMVTSRTPRVLLLDVELHRAGVERLLRKIRTISRETRI